jgi:hypothetical protein
MQYWPNSIGWKDIMIAGWMYLLLMTTERTTGTQPHYYYNLGCPLGIHRCPARRGIMDIIMPRRFPYRIEVSVLFSLLCNF